MDGQKYHDPRTRTPPKEDDDDAGDPDF